MAITLLEVSDYDFPPLAAGKENIEEIFSPIVLVPHRSFGSSIFSALGCPKRIQIIGEDFFVNFSRPL